MPSTFFGLTIAGSALNTFHVATNTVANNISNVNTKGYSRQEAVRIASEALRTNQRFGMVGTGVSTTEIVQRRDFYYDVKYWENNAKVAMYDAKLYGAQQIEDYLEDGDSVKGFSAILVPQSMTQGRCFPPFPCTQSLPIPRQGQVSR